MKTATQILNEHSLPATGPSIHAMQEYASEQCQIRDEMIKWMGAYIKFLKTKPRKDDIVHASYDTKMEQLKKKIK